MYAGVSNCEKCRIKEELRASAITEATLRQALSLALWISRLKWGKRGITA
jgi:hypothetical protein